MNLKPKVKMLYQRPESIILKCAVFVASIFLCVSLSLSSECFAESSNLLQKRKEAIFNLVDKLKLLKSPSKTDLERLFGQKLYSESLGFYETEQQSYNDVQSHGASYGPDGEIACANLEINPKFDLNLEDIVLHYGKWQEKYFKPGSKAYGSKSEAVFVYGNGHRLIYFKFEKTKPGHLKEVQVGFIDRK